MEDLANDAEDLNRHYGHLVLVVAVCDACILYLFHLRNVIVQAACSAAPVSDAL